MPRPHLGVTGRVDKVLIGTAAVLAGATATMLAIPSLQARVVAPALDLMLDSIALVVASSVTVLAWVRYRERREPFALFQSAAFLVLAIASARAVIETIGPDFRSPLSDHEPGQHQLYVFTAASIMAAALLVVGGIVSFLGHRPRYPGLIFVVPGALMIAIIVLVQAASASLPDLIWPVALPGEALSGPVPTVTPAGVAIHLVGALLFGVAALVCREIWHRDRSIGDAYVAFGLVLASFAQVFDAISPSTHPGPVATGDLLRLGFYIALLLAIEAEARSIMLVLRRANETLEQLRESEGARAALEERAWLARELHDGLAQDLWLAKLKVGRLVGLDLSSEARAVADEVSGAIDIGLAEARQAVMALRIAADSEDTFAGLVARYVEDFEDRSGLRVEFECDEDLPVLAVRTQAELLRITQEALANARRHADATVVRVRASLEDGRIRLSVVDNGRGFDQGDVRKNAYGLAAMHERAALIGAELEVRSAPGDGTRILVTAPLGFGVQPMTMATT